MSCSESRLSDRIDETDRVIIVFANESQAVEKEIETTNQTAIRKLVDYVDGDRFEKNKCNLGGRMTFYSSGELVEQVEFNTSEGCRYFTFITKDGLISTKMSNEAASFLISLKEGRLYY